MKNIVVAAVALAAASLFTSGAQAATATAIFTSDHCGGGCGPQTGGFATITGTEVGGNAIDITITPLNGNGLINAGQTTFTFNLVGDPTITYSGLPTGFTVVGGTGTGGLTQNAGSIHQDGFGNFEYGIDYTGANGANNPLFSALTFRITDGAGFGLNSFANLSTNGDPSAFFALDIISGTTGKTGLVDVTGITPFPTQFDVPIPPALPLFVAGMVGIGMLRRAVKRFKGDEIVA
jgi:hypothetical protein